MTIALKTARERGLERAEEILKAGEQKELPTARQMGLDRAYGKEPSIDELRKQREYAEIRKAAEEEARRARAMGDQKAVERIMKNAEDQIKAAEARSKEPEAKKEEAGKGEVKEKAPAEREKAIEGVAPKGMGDFKRVEDEAKRHIRESIKARAGERLQGMRDGCIDLAGNRLGIKEIISHFQAGDIGEVDGGEYQRNLERILGMGFERPVLQERVVRWRGAGGRVFEEVRKEQVYEDGKVKTETAIGNAGDFFQRVRDIIRGIPYEQMPGPERERVIQRLDENIKKACEELGVEVPAPTPKKEPEAKAIPIRVAPDQKGPAPVPVAVAPQQGAQVAQILQVGGLPGDQAGQVAQIIQQGVSQDQIAQVIQVQNGGMNVQQIAQVVQIVNQGLQQSGGQPLQPQQIAQVLQNGSGGAIGQQQAADVAQVIQQGGVPGGPQQIAQIVQQGGLNPQQIAVVIQIMINGGININVPPAPAPVVTPGPGPAPVVAPPDTTPPSLDDLQHDMADSRHNYVEVLQRRRHILLGRSSQDELDEARKKYQDAERAYMAGLSDDVVGSQVRSMQAMGVTDLTPYRGAIVTQVSRVLTEAKLNEMEEFTQESVALADRGTWSKVCNWWRRNNLGKALVGAGLVAGGVALSATGVGALGGAVMAGSGATLMTEAAWSGAAAQWGRARELNDTQLTRELGNMSDEELYTRVGAHMEAARSRGQNPSMSWGHSRTYNGLRNELTRRMHVTAQDAVDDALASGKTPDEATVAGLDGILGRQESMLTQGESQINRNRRLAVAKWVTALAAGAAVGYFTYGLAPAAAGAGPAPVQQPPTVNIYNHYPAYHGAHSIGQTDGGQALCEAAKYLHGANADPTALHNLRFFEVGQYGMHGGAQIPTGGWFHFPEAYVREAYNLAQGMGHIPWGGM